MKKKLDFHRRDVIYVEGDRAHVKLQPCRETYMADEKYKNYVKGTMNFIK